MPKQTWLGQILKIFLVFCYTQLHIYSSFLCYMTSTNSLSCVSMDGSQASLNWVLRLCFLRQSACRWGCSHQCGPALLFLGGFVADPLSPGCGVSGRHLLRCLLSSVSPSDSNMTIWWNQVCLGFLPSINLRPIQGCLLTSVEALCGGFFPVHRTCRGCRWALSRREHHCESWSPAAVLPTQEVSVVSAHSLITDGLAFTVTFESVFMYMDILPI